MRQNNIIKYLKRTALWFYLLIGSLIRYWLNHPFETPAIIRFFLKKAVYIPKFTKRNVLTEKEQFNFEENLDRVTHLYQKYGNKFNAKYKDSYTKLDK